MFWNLADILSAIILLAALILMVKFYQEYLDVGISELRDWKLVTIGFAFYIAIKTHAPLLGYVIGPGGLSGGGIGAYPWYILAGMGLVLLTASVLVFVGFYGMVKDYL